MKPKFKIGQKVKVTKDGRNASDFTSKLDLPVRGIYENENWMDKEYTILSNALETNFKFEDLSKYAYALGIDNIIFGFVYECGLEIISYKEETLPIKKTTLLQLAENNSFSEEIIKKEFPQLFESELEVGKWYKNTSNPNCNNLVFYKSDKQDCYGTSYYHNIWADDMFFNRKYNWVLATEQEVFEALKNWFEKDNKPFNNYKFLSEHNKFLGWDGSVRHTLFENGIWNKPQPKEITISEIEKILGYKILIKE